MTYNDILTSINNKIENSSYEKFLQPIVLDELNNVYRELANKTNVFETYDYILLADNQINYELPISIYRPTRAVFRGQKIDFKSQEEMDYYNPIWEAESTESELKHLIYNNLSDRRIKAYPRLTSTAVTADATEILYLGELQEGADPDYIYLYMNTVTGAKYLSTITGATPADLVEVATVYGTFLPPIVTTSDLDSTRIFIDEVHVNALIYGTAGYLLLNMGRTEDRAKGEGYLKIYGLDETEIGAIRKKDFNGGFRNTSRRRHYRTPFDE